jgi:glycosyltransferase involved in cell wall biosynthesis
MNPVKVAHMTTVDMSVRHLLLNQLLALREGGFQVGAVSAAGPDLGPVHDAGVQHWPVDFTRRMTPLRDLKAAWQIWRLCRRERFTIVHTHQIKAALFGQLAARLAGVPIVVNTIHGFYFHEHTPPAKRRAWIVLERLCASLSDLLLSQNREDIGTAIQCGICPADRIQHLGNGIDVRRFDPHTIPPGRLAQLRAELGIPHDALVVGFVGRLVREKGILELFDAARRLRERHPRLRLLVVGPVDTDKPDYLGPAAARRQGIGDITVFAGYRHDMPDMYALMDVLTLPSHREGLPRAPMEASAMGVPTVATAIRGCREVVRPDQNGFLVPLSDVDALTTVLDRVLGDEALRMRLGTRARELARAEFDEQVVFARVRTAYLRLLEAKGMRTPTVVAAGARCASESGR